MQQGSEIITGTQRGDFSKFGRCTMFARPYRARFYSNFDGRFKDLCNANVLIYWPHGFGDWVFLSYVLPFLEPTNRYWITRFGDDTVALMEGNEWAIPVYLGTNSPHCDDGAAFGNRHLGLDLAQADGSEREMNLPLSLYEACLANKIDTVLLTNFPETYGFVPFPFHSKARNIIRDLAPVEHLHAINLGLPMRTTIDFRAPGWVLRWVEARLKSRAGWHGRKKLCLLGRTGYSSTGKNWGHRWREEMPPGMRREGDECREFMRLLLQKDPGWVFLSMEDRHYSGDDTLGASDLNCFTYTEIFNSVLMDANVPFGLVTKALTNFAEIAVGVPAGPFHLCMAKRELPAVGIWLEHFPSWYDEPKGNAIHIVSKNVADHAMNKRPGSFERNEHLNFRVVWADTYPIMGEQVLQAVESL